MSFATPKKVVPPQSPPLGSVQKPILLLSPPSNSGSAGEPVVLSPSPAVKMTNPVTIDLVDSQESDSEAGDEQEDEEEDAKEETQDKEVDVKEHAVGVAKRAYTYMCGLCGRESVVIRFSTKSNSNRGRAYKACLQRGCPFFRWI